MQKKTTHNYIFNNRAFSLFLVFDLRIGEDVWKNICWLRIYREIKTAIQESVKHIFLSVVGFFSLFSITKMK